MANIKAYIDKIKNAIYGEEVRGSMVNALNALDTTLDEHIKNHPASDGSVSPEQIESAIGNYLTKNPIVESDPTVPQWAKEPTKPTYTASEVGALPNSTHIPTQLAEMTEDTTHRVVTDAEKQAWNNKSDFSGSYNDLTNKPTIPSKLSEMTGDVNNRTVTDAEKNVWNAKAEKSDIPDVTSFATKTELGNKADKTEIANLATKADLNSKASQTEVNQLKENLTKLTECEIIKFTELYVIKNIDATVDLTNPTRMAGVAYAIEECKEGDKFTVSGHSNYNYRLWCFVDDQSNVLEREIAYDVNIDKKVIVAPKNSVKAIFNSYHINANQMRCNAYKGIVPSVSIDKVEKESSMILSNGFNLVRIPLLNDGYLNASGAIVKSAGWYHTDLIEIDNVSKDIDLVEKNMSVAWASYYDSNKKWISADNNYSSFNLERRPQNAKYIVFSAKRHANNRLNALVQKKATSKVLENVEKNEKGEIVKYSITREFERNVYCSFSFKFTDGGMKYVGEYNPLFIASISSNKLVCPAIWLKKYTAYKGNVYRQAMVGTNNNTKGSNAKVYQTSGFLNPFNGDTAFYVQYLGASNNVKMSATPSEVTLLIDNVSVASISYLPTDGIDKIIDFINGTKDFKAIFENIVTKRCEDLCFNIGNIDIPLTYQLTLYGSGAYTGKPLVNIPYAKDNEWHICEIFYDKNTNKSYVSFDGYTVESQTDLASNYDDFTISIGCKNGNFGDAIEIRDIDIAFDCENKVEIITDASTQYNHNPQMISDLNPKLLIFEGHGIDVCADKNAPLSDNMATSTDRMMWLFETLKNKGYVPVTMKDVIEWKINGKKLPRRCYAMMFDDYRVENFVEYDKRIPFEKYNVKPSLAIMSNVKQLTDLISANGKKYTVEKCIDMIQRAGWHMCSHTHDHTKVTTHDVANVSSWLKEAALSCNDLGISSDVLVYPESQCGVEYIPALTHSAFKLGMHVDYIYNCKAKNNFAMHRIDIGTRTSIDKILESIK